MTDRLDILIHAGEIHKQVQTYAHSILKVDANLFELATSIEDKIKELINFNVETPLKGGVAFPTGLSINECAAHWSPNPTNITETLHRDDLLKIDFGVHVDGHIIDGAFSHSFSEKYNDIHRELIRISQEATECGISNSGPEAILGEIGESIQEVIESYDICGKKVLSTIDLCGHSIARYRIHDGKAVPNIKIRYFERMKVGEEFAIETFPTTGSGNVKSIDQMNTNHFHFSNNNKTKNKNKNKNEKHSHSIEYYRTTNNPPECSHYMIEKFNKKFAKNDDYKSIYEQFNTLAFCKRWVNNENDDLQKLVKKDYIKEYPPLYDVKGSFVAQTEKSIYITESGSIILN